MSSLEKKKGEKNWKFVVKSTHLQSRWFLVVDRMRTKAKCTKMKIARTKRRKQLFFIVKFVNLWRSCRRRRLGFFSALLIITIARLEQTRYPMNVSPKDNFTESSQLEKASFSCNFNALLSCPLDSNLQYAMYFVNKLASTVVFAIVI